MLRRGRAVGVWRGAWLGVLVSCLCGCSWVSSSAPSAGPAETQTIQTAQTVQVEVRSITSVVVVDGIVTATPDFVVQAPSAGQVAYSSAIQHASALLLGSAGLASQGGSVVSTSGDSTMADMTPLAVAADTELGSVAGTAFTSPASGQITAVLVENGATVAARIPLIEVRYSGFGVTVTVPSEDQYRLYDGAMSAKTNVDGGPAGVDCHIVALPSGTQANSGTSGVPIVCLLPLDTPVVDGLSAKVGLTTAQKTDVPALPVQAVSGRAGQGEVTRVNADGSESVVSVGLGVTDGSYIEITAGLNVGDTVLAYAPGIGG